ncbi:MAG TPA: hypothetical protein VIV57_16735 [Anaeromyxobacter sp.]
MKRTFLAGGVAVAILFGVSVTLVLLLSGGAGPAASAPDAPGAEALLPPAAPVAMPPPPRAAAGVGPMKLRASSWNAPAESPSSAPMASRVIRKIVRKALLAAPVQSRLARCADRTGGFGGTAAPGPIPRARPAVLVLELEVLGGEVRIEDVQVREWGGASEAMVSCARTVLKGRALPAPTARQEPARTAGPERMRMPFPLNPRSEAVALSR